MKEVQIIRQSLTQLYPPEKVARVINLCDNLFFNNYLEKGVLESRENIQATIKAKVIQTFINFFGKRHEDKIIHKVAGANMKFIYQTSGGYNSIADFLMQTKSVRFQQCTNLDLTKPVYFKYIARALNSNTDILEVCKKAPELMSVCLQGLGLTEKELKRSKRTRNKATKKIKEFGRLWDNVTYSDNLEINYNLMFLEKFVNQVENNILLSRRHLMPDSKIDEDDDIFRIMLDPVVMSLDPNANAWSLFIDAQMCAFHVGKEHCLYFGTCPDDTTVLHEFLHELNGPAFEKGYIENGQTGYSQRLRKHQMFNEGITDYFSLMMFAERVKQNKQAIIHSDIEKSGYQILFGALAPFLSAYLPELKEATMREFPSEELMRIIGKEAFEKIVLACNELVALHSDQSILRQSQKEQMPIQNFLKEYPVDFYGSIETPLSEVDARLLQVQRQLYDVIKHVVRQQPLRKKIETKLREKSQGVADYLLEKQNPCFHKLTRLADSWAAGVKAYTERHSIKRMQAPLTEIDLLRGY